MENNSIVLVSSEYIEFSDFLNDFSNLLNILMKHKYEVLVHKEDDDMYIIDFTYDPRITDFGNDLFMKISVDEEEIVRNYRENLNQNEKRIEE